MYNSFECSDREWSHLQNAFRDAKLEIAHRCGYKGNMLPDGNGTDFSLLADFGDIPCVAQDGSLSLVSVSSDHIGEAFMRDGELCVDGVFQSCSSVRDVMKVMSDRCLSKQNVECLVANVKSAPFLVLFPVVDVIRDGNAGVSHYFFDRYNFAVENYISRLDGVSVMHERFSESVDSMVSSVRDEVYASVRERASMEGGVGISAPLVETFFFTGKELVPEGKLYELVGRGTDVSVQNAAMQLAVDSLRGEVIRECLAGTKFQEEEVKAFFPEKALLPNYNSNCFSIEMNSSSAYKAVAATSQGLQKVTSLVREPENMKTLKNELVSALQKKQSLSEGRQFGRRA